MALSRVLVVDEDPHVRRMFERALGGSCELSLARSVQVAVEMLGSACFDVIVADLHVPETRFEVLRAIERCTPPTEVIEIVGRPLGARSAEDSSGAHPRLVKPLDPVLAERTVKRAIERRGLRAEVKRLREELEAVGFARDARDAE